MSVALPTSKPHDPDPNSALRAIVRLLGRQAAREMLTMNPKEKEADYENEEQGEGSAQGGNSDHAK